ncbi:copper resistance CopC family protein [Micromonospora sp. WMMD975]|uniref:copper resistance CopC family protein n=1 Tax=Micromonospora sp. WMMD975 TaxID=3016087 RepID=UPI00249AF9A4|nr:copper resistance CopC family protein [Micromonospora sp. WMMD975]WFE36400.1 copper resistance protein CopC [Micromonospora sp. WMMD975]
MSPGLPEPDRPPDDGLDRGPAAPAARWRRAAAVSVALLAVAVVALGATVARTPARLESLNPADGARLATAPAAVTLSFSGRVDPREVHVSVVGAGGLLPAGPVRADGRTVTAPLPPVGPGSYRLGYHVVLGDGREVSGEAGFRIGADTGAESVPSVPDQAADAGGHDHLGSGPLTVGLLLLGTVLTGFAVAALLRRPTRDRDRA